MKRKVTGRGLLALALFACAAGAPAAAAPREAKTVSLNEAFDLVSAGKYKQALDQADRMLAAASAQKDNQVIAGSQFVRATALLGLKRAAEAKDAAIASMESAGRADFGASLVDMFLQAKDGPGAAALLDRYLDLYPSEARQLDFSGVRDLMRYIKEAQGKQVFDNFMVRLAAGGLGGDLEQHDYAVLDAAEIWAKRGDLDQARTLAASFTLRTVAIFALTNRRYEALWPTIEQASGPHLERLGRVAIMDTEAAGIAPDAPVPAKLALFRAYRDAGQDQKAEQLGAAFAATPDELAALNEDGGWLVNDHALLLARLGKIDAADARFASLNALPIEQHPWVLNMMLNRLDMLVGYGRPAIALGLIDQTIAVAQTWGSPTAQQLLRRTKICALHQLGRDAEAQAMGGDLVAHAQDSLTSTIDGYFCLGRGADAEALAIQVLADPEKSSDLIQELQPVEAQVSADPSLWNTFAADLRRRPAVMTALNKAGRILPESLWPTPVTP